MQKDYETFVEKLEIGIYEATGIPRENISFEKEGGRFAPVGDRLLAKFAEHDDAGRSVDFIHRNFLNLIRMAVRLRKL